MGHTGTISKRSPPPSFVLYQLVYVTRAGHQSSRVIDYRVNPIVGRRWPSPWPLEGPPFEGLGHFHEGAGAAAFGGTMFSAGVFGLRNKSAT